MSQNKSMVRHRLDNATWDKIYAYLKVRPKIHTEHEETCRIFVDAVHWIMRTGAQWRDVAEELGKGNTVFKRFARWSDKGIWDELHEHFIDEPDMEWLLIDSTVVRAHPCAAGAPKENGGQEEQALGKSVGGFSTKIHVTVDALGNPLRLLLTGGQRSDSTQAIALLEGFDFDTLLADRGYDSDKILEFVAQNDAEAVIRVPSGPRKIVWFREIQIGIPTRFGIWLNVLCTKSNSIGVSFHGLRNMPLAIRLFSVLPLLLSGFVKYVNRT